MSSISSVQSPTPQLAFSDQPSFKLNIFSKTRNSIVQSTLVPSMPSPPVSPHPKVASMACSPSKPPPRTGSKMPIVSPVSSRSMSPSSANTITEKTTPETSPSPHLRLSILAATAEKRVLSETSSNNIRAEKKLKHDKETGISEPAHAIAKPVTRSPLPAPINVARKPILKTQPPAVGQPRKSPVELDLLVEKLKEPFPPPEIKPFGTYHLENFGTAAPLTSCCWDRMKQNPRAYLASERKTLLRYKRHTPKSPNHVVTAHSTVRKARALQAAPASTRSKPSTATVSPVEPFESRATRNRKASSKALAAALDLSLPNTKESGAVTSIAPKTPLSTPKKPRAKPASETASKTPKSAKARTAVRSPKTPKTPRSGLSSTGAVQSRVHDLPDSLIADYAPPPSSLPAGKSLRVEWKGSPVDLSADPLVSQVPAAELQLAATLRLTCQMYMDSKKRLFAEKVHRLKNGLPFRRTDAQKACRIDVNKASRLFTAYEKVGWLEDAWFQKFL